MATSLTMSTGRHTVHRLPVSNSWQPGSHLKTAIVLHACLLLKTNNNSRDIRALQGKDATCPHQLFPSVHMGTHKCANCDCKCWPGSLRSTLLRSHPYVSAGPSTARVRVCLLCSCSSRASLPSAFLMILTAYLVPSLIDVAICTLKPATTGVCTYGLTEIQASQFCDDKQPLVPRALDAG